MLLVMSFLKHLGLLQIQILNNTALDKTEMMVALSSMVSMWPAGSYL